jgi:hypothetical protein
MTEIVIRDGIVSSLTTQPTIVWDAIRNGDNPYGTFDSNSFITWNDYSTSTTFNLVSYFDENHDMELPQYYEWKNTFFDVASLSWSLYGLSYNSFFKYNGDNILFNTNGYGFGAVIQLLPKTDSIFNSGSNIFSLISTTGNSNDPPSWIPISLDYDLSQISPTTIHRFHFRVGREYATITINASSFDITKPHVYSIRGLPSGDIIAVYLYIDSKLVAQLTGFDFSAALGWQTYNTATPNSFIVGGNVGLELPSPYTTKKMGVYSIFFYQDSYNYAEIFDLCKYRYNVPDVTFTPSVTYTTFNPPYVSVFGATFDFGIYMSIL